MVSLEIDWKSLYLLLDPVLSMALRADSAVADQPWPSSAVVSSFSRTARLSSSDGARSSAVSISLGSGISYRQKSTASRSVRCVKKRHATISHALAQATKRHKTTKTEPKNHFRALCHARVSAVERRDKSQGAL